MKNQLKKYSLSLFSFLLTMFFSAAAFAQDGGLDIDVNIGKEEWYQQPWAWIVGGAIFVLILVALLRKRK
ncbi:hypothetical protein [Algoriphagus antarcticus]|uniref:Secreted protein with PEP-CTERM sorting signal n=1 Tax=Algoriphagus antarcticus TaxID=238540 RepID=A0A3E0E1A6_9BACT|nr:hypothetical protein [Algoriphagus antarcticus]REG92018.1 hypothetical protein C8N25_10395 [Algoriphagus antarcticus]